MKKRSLINRLGFSNDDLNSVILSFPNDEDLSNRLGSVFHYDKDKSEAMKTRFYWIDARNLSLDISDIQAIHKRIWNENKSDLLFIENNDTIEIKYVSTSPLEGMLDIVRINTSIEDITLLERISKEHITTGAFWIEYNDALNRVEKNKKTVDQSLVWSLGYLRKELDAIYEPTIQEETERRRIVQALIDRTLFIKFLEDKKIINSAFYKKCFGNGNINYKELLMQRDATKINLLFTYINEVFNNKLFDTPKIENQSLPDSVLTTIANTISATHSSGQLSLFDFQFDIIPIEFISRIYQIFLDDKKKEGGIYYTPEGLAKLVLNNVIRQQGKILDPSCGSGMFLILAFRKMYVASGDNLDTRQKIQHRLEFIKENIFGIEIESTAARLALFSLYLEVLNSQEITSDQLNKLVTEDIDSENNKPLFAVDFSDNIKEGNALSEGEKGAFFNTTFDYIIGNPPWFRINQDKEDINYSYWNKYSDLFTRERQISQCFLHRIKSWSKDNTRYGFIVNSSNFINDSEKFQRFFYSTYCIESFFELYHVKDILFDYAYEPACVVIFNNDYLRSRGIEYYLPQLNSFAKTFKTILLNQSDVVSICQADLIDKKISLRDYLIGSSSELALANKIELESDTIAELMLEDIRYNSCRGFQDWGRDALKNEFDKKEDELTKSQYVSYNNLFLNKYYSNIKNTEHYIPYVKSAQLERFSLTVDTYCQENITNFDRPRNPFIYSSDKILCTRIGGVLKAVYSKDKIYFGTDIFIVKLHNPDLYHVVTCCLNSDLINYYTQVKLRKRIDGALTRLNATNMKRLPIPNKIDTSIIGKLNNISQDIHSGIYTFNEKKDELNDLIFDLYDLNYIERLRISDFFISENQTITKLMLEDYCLTFYKTIKRFLKTGITRMEYSYNSNMPFDITGVKIVFGSNENNTPTPEINNVQLYINHQLLKQVGSSALIALKERIYSEDSIFIIKDKNPKNWTKSAAYDDARVEIEKLLQNA